MHRIRELDGLRAIAALLVISWHYIGVPDGTDFVLGKVFYLGHFGVDLFFVLSGYLITTMLLENRESDAYYSSFYGRRAFRIWPIYYLMCVVCFLGWWSDKYPELFDGLIPGWTYIAGIQNFWMAKLQSYGAYWLAGTWSLAIEEQFYLIFPLVVRFVPVAVLPKVLTAIIFVCPIGRFVDSFTADAFGYYVLPQFRADVLSIGAIIAWWSFSGKKSERTGRNVRLVLIISATMLPLICIAGPATFHAAAWQHTLAAFFCGAVLFVILENRGSPLLAPLRSKIGRHLANWSYASYMSHHWVAYIVFSLLHVNRTLTTISGAATTVLAFVATLSLCALSYRLFERPLNQYAHRRFAFGKVQAPLVDSASTQVICARAGEQ